jgi:hypothetical protein
MNNCEVIQNNSFYSLHNVENYKNDFLYTTSFILNKHLLLINEYLNFIFENINNQKYNICNNFIIIRGMETISHVFHTILYYTKNIDLAYYHSQKAFYFYVEFIGQISVEHHTFLQLNSRDATMFVYKKTIFDINNSYKNSNKYVYNKHQLDQLNNLYLQTNIIKELINYYINNSCYLELFNSSTEIKKHEIQQYITKVIKLVKTINFNQNKVLLGNILNFIINITNEIDIEKYYNIIYLFVKKFSSCKYENKCKNLINNIYNPQLSVNLLNYSEDEFILWIFSSQ